MVAHARKSLATAKPRPTVALMMSPEWLGASVRYNRWMNDKLYGLAATLTDEARKRDAGAFFKSIHGTFNHLLLADRVWLARFKGVTVPDEFLGPGGIRSLDQELCVDFEDLRRERALTDDDFSAWVSGLTHERLAAPLVYVRRGHKQEPPLWWAVAHASTIRPIIADRSRPCSRSRAAILAAPTYSQCCARRQRGRR